MYARFVVFSLLLGAAPARPEMFSVGIKGGVPITDAFHTARNGPLSFFSGANRYAVGPTVELHLPLRLAIEFDALYRRLNYGSDTILSTHTDPNATRATRVSGNAWEFPLLLKCRFASGLVRPYVASGASFQSLSDLKHVRSFFDVANRPVSQTDQPPELRKRFNAGFVVGGGLELKAGILRVSPELRYTRWGWDSFRDFDGLLRSNQDQALFLLGITF